MEKNFQNTNFSYNNTKVHGKNFENEISQLVSGMDLLGMGHKLKLDDKKGVENEVKSLNINILNFR